MNTVLIYCSALLASCVKPSRRSVSNHLLPFPGRSLLLFPGLTAWPYDHIPLGTMASLGLRPIQGIGHDNQPNRVR